MKLTRPLSKNESNLIKGISILLIIFHNYFHIIPPSPGENQFSFSALNFERFRQLLIADPFSIIRYILAYFGHYGVQMFIFISGYGLYISIKNREIPYFKFLGDRVKKLYPTLLIIVIFLLVVIPIWEKGINPRTIKSLLLKLTLLFNFIPGEAMSVTGPFWFFSLIFQLYIIFAFLVYLIKRFGSVSMLVIGAVSLLTTIILNNSVGYFRRLLRNFERCPNRAAFSHAILFLVYYKIIIFLHPRKTLLVSLEFSIEVLFHVRPEKSIVSIHRVAFPVAAAGAGAYLILRRHHGFAERMSLALEQVLDRVEYGETRRPSNFFEALAMRRLPRSAR